MRKMPLVIAIGMICGTYTGLAVAESKQDRMNAMEERLQSQEQVIQEKQARIEHMNNSYSSYFATNDNDQDFAIEVSGLIEVQAKQMIDDEHGDSSDLTVPTAEIGIHAKINDWVSGDLVALYEEDTNNDGDLELDVARINIADPNDNWFVYAGQYTLPFGAYHTHMIADPITMELAEMGDSAVEFGTSLDGFNVSAFIFQGDHSNGMDSYGISLNTSHEIDGFILSGHLAYVSNLAESDSIVDAGWVRSDDDSSAWALGAQLESDDFTVIGEYIAASKGFADADDEKPSAYQLEGAWHFDAMNKPATVAIGYQASSDAENSNWDLAEQRTLIGASVEVFEGTVLGVEYQQDSDYSGEDTSSFTGQVAVEF